MGGDTDRIASMACAVAGEARTCCQFYHEDFELFISPLFLPFTIPNECHDIMACLTTNHDHSKNERFQNSAPLWKPL